MASNQQKSTEEIIAEMERYVAERKREHALLKKQKSSGKKCTKCGKTVTGGEFKFCPYCGSGMTVSVPKTTSTSNTLADRARQLDKGPDTFERRVKEWADLKCKYMIRDVESFIIEGKYNIENGKKVLQGRVIDVEYYIDTDYPEKTVSTPELKLNYGTFVVRNEYEAKYLCDEIVRRLKKEGFICEIESSSSTRQNGDGFWDSLFKGTTTTYSYRVNYRFEWR